MHPTPGDHAMGLRGGRTLGFTIYGGPSGSPVINCHGGLLSGHDVSPADDLASSLGLCIISPDRPGINRTSRLSNQGLLPWVRADLVPLLDYLELGTISVMGWSEGGQYALAVSLALAERVTKCAVLAGCPPLDNPETFKELNRLDHALAILARRTPFAVRAVAAGTRQLARYSPGMLMRSSLRGQPVAEIASVKEQGRWLPTTLGEGRRTPEASSTSTALSWLPGDSAPRISRCRYVSTKGPPTLWYQNRGDACWLTGSLPHR